MTTYDFVKTLEKNKIYTVIIEGQTIKKTGDELRSYLITHSIESIDFAEEVKQTEHKVTAPTKKIDTTIDNK